MMREAPESLAIAPTSRPTAPAPMIRTVDPGARLPLRSVRRVEWIATERGSIKDAVAYETFGGSLHLCNE